MADEVAQALQAAIDKWQDVVNGGSDPGPSKCALCDLFNNDESKETDLDCEGCPIMAATGRWKCYGTPWMRWLELTSGKFGPADTLAKMEVAKANLEFCREVQHHGKC